MSVPPLGGRVSSACSTDADACPENPRPPSTNQSKPRGRLAARLATLARAAVDGDNRLNHPGRAGYNRSSMALSDVSWAGR
jgi:hypothetical protein